MHTGAPLQKRMPTFWVCDIGCGFCKVAIAQQLVAQIPYQQFPEIEILTTLSAKLSWSY